jgi:hypothetical protein
MITTASVAFEIPSRSRTFPSGLGVKRGFHFVRSGEKELVEKLGAILSVRLSGKLRGGAAALTPAVSTRLGQG